MPQHENAPTIYPYLRYDDAKRAIGFLVEAFGFREMMVVPGEGDTIAHAQLALGTGVVMLSTAAGDSERSPRALPAVPGGIYAYAADPDAHCDRARAAGAKILREPEDTDYGSREYTAEDLEGHHWSFGTYRPAPSA
jgi:uncharacterized glyoxalase superfamily protein PhnB